MNWYKIQKILICLLIVINMGLFLLYKNFADDYKLTSSQINNIHYVLENNNILLYDHVPQEYKPKAKLNVESIQYDEAFIKAYFKSNYATSIQGNNEIYSKGSESITLSLDNNIMLYKNDEALPVGDVDGLKVEQMAKQFIKQFLKDEYDLRQIFISNKKDHYEVEYNEVYKDQVIFSSYIRLKISNDGVYEAEVQRFKPIQFVQNQNYIFPADEVLYNFMNYIKQIHYNEQVTILGINIGYSIGFDYKGNNINAIAIPYYRISLGNGEVHYINCYKNEINRNFD